MTPRCCLAVLLICANAGAAQAQFTMQQVKSYPFPNELAAAATGSRIAWAMNEEGRRNIYVAEGPEWRTRKLTSFDVDDGQVLTRVQLSPDGKWVVFRRGGDDANWDQDDWGLAAVNATSAPTQPRIQIFSVPFAGGIAKVIAEGGDGIVVGPKSDMVLFERSRQIWSVPIDGSGAAAQLFFARGDNGSAAYSPDGSKLAFVSDRGTHSIIGIYQDSMKPVQWIAPSTNRDASPRWSIDGTRIAFVRRAGGGGPPQPSLERRHQRWSILTADVQSGVAREIWKAPQTLAGSPPTTHGGTNLHWAAGDRIVFLSYHDGWPHLYSLPAGGGAALLLTPGDYMAEHIKLSADKRYVVFAGNAGSTAGDIDRRHIVKAPVDRQAPQVLTPGQELEWAPVVTGDGSTIALISATAQRPPLPAVMPAVGGRAKLLAEDRIPASFPTRALVVPGSVTFRAADGVTVRGQVFTRDDVRGRKPAVIFIHGGPPRQMLAGWNYSDYYSNAYAAQQFFASRGYVALSVNYRLGIGYGFAFHRPDSAGAQGASEYRDIVAAARYLRARSDVDAARIAVWGGSYGGYLTALALARNSDLFAAGVDIHGVHNFADRFTAPLNRYEPTDRARAAEIAWRASPVAYLSTWRSPVLLIHGDDDRNVRFAETADLARRLEATDVHFESLVIPDDTHHFLRHANWTRVNEATFEFIDRMLKP
ncbi:MAG TPA: prolyl oligopeptidase family serine peptidase [Longimicrobiales bacterium]|nr:prolyl oligopeptidase family serine peptidase [Longimicrobiales bacterium]